MVVFYRNPGHDGSLYDCLLDLMARAQSPDPKAVFVFMGDANAHHAEWLGSVSPTDGHGRDALSFCTLSACTQLVQTPTHAAGNRLDLLLTNVPDVARVSVPSPHPLGTSDHSVIE